MLLGDLFGRCVEACVEACLRGLGRVVDRCLDNFREGAYARVPIVVACFNRRYHQEPNQ